MTADFETNSVERLPEDFGKLLLNTDDRRNENDHQEEIGANAETREDGETLGESRGRKGWGRCDEERRKGKEVVPSSGSDVIS